MFKPSRATIPCIQHVIHVTCSPYVVTCSIGGEQQMMSPIFTNTEKDPQALYQTLCLLPMLLTASKASVPCRQDPESDYHAVHAVPRHRVHTLKLKHNEPQAMR